MPVVIPNSQIETWSHQGSITQSSDTYRTIRGVLAAEDTPFATKNCSVFLQGSYGNDTNIYSESDVDVVIQLDDCFHHDLRELPPEQQAAFEAAHSKAAYGQMEFRRDVQSVLQAAFGDAVSAGSKAVRIAAGGARRRADVVAAIQYRRYHKFNSIYDQNYDRGICLSTTSGDLVVNYPRQHSENCTKKHQGSGSRYKPLVRILKNLRTRLVESGAITKDLAPSYFLEGLLYNVPDSEFVGDHQDTFVAALSWILKADRKDFVCANRQYYLLRDGDSVTWRADKCTAFLDAVVKAWTEW